MNALLDSQFQSLTLNYLRYGLFTAVNNIWTLVTSLTAAVGFWRVKSSSQPSLKPDPTEARETRCLNGPSPSTCESPRDERTAEPAWSTDSGPQKPVLRAADGNGVTSGKFTVCFRKEDDDEDEWFTVDFDDVNDGVEFGAVGTLGEAWYEGWEKALRTRMGVGKSGWYRNQDSTVIDGNIVRFWDGCNYQIYQIMPSLAVCRCFIESH